MEVGKWGSEEDLPKMFVICNFFFHLPIILSSYLPNFLSSYLPYFHLDPKNFLIFVSLPFYF